MSGPELSLGEQRRLSDVVAEHAPGPVGGADVTDGAAVTK
jgi:hypothetical protein